MSQKGNERKKGVLVIETELAAVDSGDVRQKDSANGRTRIVLWVASAIIIAQLLSLIPAVIDTFSKLFS
ncbi:hypothetical protein GWD52_05840 [Enterobacteriaceae bacterium 4M9]|nr:hypothetical protein [Enterobacteriaceae bacterium 4M9]